MAAIGCCAVRKGERQAKISLILAMVAAGHRRQFKDAEAAVVMDVACRSIST